MNYNSVFPESCFGMIIVGQSAMGVQRPLTMKNDNRSVRLLTTSNARLDELLDPRMNQISIDLCFFSSDAVLRKISR